MEGASSQGEQTLATTLLLCCQLSTFLHSSLKRSLSLSLPV